LIRLPKKSNAATHCGLVRVTLPLSSVSWQPLASAKCSKVCWVKVSPALVAATIPSTLPAFSLSAAALIAS
jgi:hypothetical protein